MTSLRRILAIAATGVRRTVRRPLNLLWLVAVPLFFAGPVASMFAQSGQVPQLPVVVEDGGRWVTPLLDSLAATPMRIRRLDRPEAERLLQAGRERLVLVVPEGFSASVDAGRPRLELLRGPRYEPGLEVHRIRAVAAGLATGRSPGALPVETRPPRGEAWADAYPHLRGVFGIYAMLVLTTLLNHAAGLHVERARGTLARTLVAGVPYAEVVAGQAAGLLLVGLLQSAVVLGVTGLLGAPWLGAGPAALALAVLPTLIAACGLSLGVAGLTRTPQQVYAAATLIGTISAMLGGAFWPLEVVPAAVQEVARLSPVYWAMESVREAFAFGGPGAAQLQPAAVLLLMGLLGGVAGVLGLRRWAA